MKHQGILLLFVLLAVALATPADAQRTLGISPGNWVATGMVATEASSPMEPARCRTQVETDAGDQSYTIRGRCAVAAGAGTLVLQFFDVGDGGVRAGFTAPPIVGVVQLDGTRVDRTISLTSLEPYSLGGILYDVRSTIIFQNDNQFSFRDWNAPAGTTQWQLVTDLDFVRQEESE